MAQEHEIVSRVYGAKGNSQLADQLIRDYLPFIKAETSEFTGRSIQQTAEDEVSIAMMAFHQAIEGYEKARGSFLSFAAVVIRNRLIDYQRKEGRHSRNLSLDTTGVGYEGELSLIDSMEDPSDDYLQSDIRDATKDEILVLSTELQGLGLSLTDMADNCPKQSRTLKVCQQAVAFLAEDPKAVMDIKHTGKLPLARITEELKLPRKTLERHRKYILGLVVIYSNGYKIIRGHLKQVFRPLKGGEAE